MLSSRLGHAASQARRATCQRLFKNPTRVVSNRFIGRQTRFTLNTGATIPALGFGTFQDPDAQEEAYVCASARCLNELTSEPVLFELSS